MNVRLASWLKRPIAIRRPRKPPSAAARKVQKAFQFLVITALVVFVTWRLRIGWQIHEQFTRLSAAGLPTSGAELNQWLPQLADEQNAAAALNEAFALCPPLPLASARLVSDSKLLSRTNRWDPATVRWVSDYLNTNNLAIERAARAVSLPQCRYPIDFEFGPETPLPHLAKLKDLARAAGLRAALQSSNRWPENVLLQLKLGRTLDSEPELISHLVRNAILRLAVQVTERDLNSGAVPEGELCQKLQEAFSSAAETNLLPAALIGERALAIPVFRLSWKEIQSFQQEDELERKHKPQRYSGKGTWFLWATGFFERDLNFFLKTMQNSIERAAMPWPARLQITNEFEAASELAQRKHYLMSMMLLPALSRAVIRDAVTQAHVELAATSLAIERFRHARGNLPARLDELAPEFIHSVPKDPFDGTSLKYKPLDQGYVVYSVGEDGQDDGGREGPEYKKPEDKNSYDIVFKVER